MFWNRRPRSRVIGSILIFLVLLLPALWYDLLPVGLIPLQVPWADTRVLLFYAWLLVATIVAVRYVDHRPIVTVGLGLYPWTAREFGLGLLLGALMGTVALLPALVQGEITRADSPAAAMLPALTMFLFAAGEELLFRGYLFQRGLELLGDVGGTLLSAVIFLVAHLGNPGLTPVAVVNLFLAGIFFGGLFVATRSLWSVIGAHAAWNLLVGPLFGLPVSGIDGVPSVFHVTTTLPTWVVGGVFGPEGGVSATVAMTVGMIIVVASSRYRIAPWAFSRTFYAEVRNRSGNRANLSRGDGS